MKIQIPQFNKAHVLVVGDIMLDRYWQGHASRISPEAPVPVVAVQSAQERPGGAANVALNVAALGAACTLIGVVGDDTEGEFLKTRLEAAGVNCQFVVIPGYSTTVKLRVVSQHQQLLRLDFEASFLEGLAGESAAVLEKLRGLVEVSLAQCDALILEDYDKGVITDPAVYIQMAITQAVPVIVDPKHKTFAQYRGATLIKPNLQEFEAAVGVCKDYKALQRAAESVLRDCDLAALLITRGADGMLLTERDRHLSLPSRAVDVHDVTGAGDTVAAILGVMLALNASFEASALLANIAASIVVTKSGTAAVTVPEIKRALPEGLHADRGLLDAEALVEQVVAARALGEKIVFTNGCFDILHAGHITYLEEARSLGDRLIVAINSDASVTALKGEGRPVNDLESRMHVLSGLSAVDWAVSFSEQTPENLLRALQPDLLVKGGDYGVSEVVGAEIVEAYGGQVKVLGLVAGLSTTNILAKVKQ